MPALEFAQLTARQLEALPRDRTLFFFPLGPLEDHGPHLPLGLDLLEARKLCELLAVRLEAELPGWTGVLLPAAPLGIEGDTTALALTVRGHVLRDWLVDACRALMREGFRYFGAMAGNPGPRTLTAIEEAGRIIGRRGPAYWLKLLRAGSRGGPDAIRPVLISLRSTGLDPAVVRGSPLWPDPREHGGSRDTSLALWLAPELVSPDYKELPPTARPAPRFWKRAWLRSQFRTRGYWGKPAQALPQAGETALRDAVSDIFPPLRAVLSGGNPQRLFRSWYSALLPNKSFFKAWLLAIALALLMFMWAYAFVASLTNF